MNKSGSTTRRIGIDARFYGPIGKGLGRYTQEVVDRLVRLDTEHEYFIFLSPTNFAAFKSPRSGVTKILVKARWYGWQEQIILPWLIWRHRLDLVHFCHFNVPLVCPIKFVVTIHDLILLKFPTQRATTLSPFLYHIKYLAFQAVMRRAARAARQIIAVSNFTKQDILAAYFLPATKIKVIYEGVSQIGSLSAISSDQSLIPLADQPFFLSVGSAYPHKNLECWLEVFRLFKNNPARASWRLLLVGGSADDYFYRRLRIYAQDLGLYGQTDSPVIFLNTVTDATLQTLYEQARGYLFPSLYEGFGLPALEAMAAGCPVAVAERSSLPEICGSAALYFDPESHDSFLAAVNRLADDEIERARLRQAGYAQIKKYSWQICAAQTLAVYQQVLAL